MLVYRCVTRLAGLTWLKIAYRTYVVTKAFYSYDFSMDSHKDTACYELQIPIHSSLLVGILLQKLSTSHQSLATAFLLVQVGIHVCFLGDLYADAQLRQSCCRGTQWYSYRRAKVGKAHLSFYFDHMVYIRISWLHYLLKGFF